MASVTVTLHGTLNIFVAGRDRTMQVELQEPSTAGELLRRLDLPVEILSLLLLNGKRADLDVPITAGDTIEAFPACGGGRSEGLRTED